MKPKLRIDVLTLSGSTVSQDLTAHTVHVKRPSAPAESSSETEKFVLTIEGDADKTEMCIICVSKPQKRGAGV